MKLKNPFIFFFIYFSWFFNSCAKTKSIQNAEIMSLICAISNAQTLKDMAKKHPKGNCFLVANIDLTNIVWQPIQNFEGSLDGRGYHIKGLNIDAKNTDDVGLFAALKNAKEIKNLIFDGASVRGKNRVGILAGYVKNTTIKNIFSEGSVFGLEDVGGLIGYLEGTFGKVLLEQSAADVAIEGSKKIGGLVGDLHAAEIQNVYFTGSIKSENTSEYIGGLVGRADGKSRISYAYSSGEINTSSKKYVGGLVGYIANNYGSVNSFYLANKHLPQGQPFGTALRVDQLHYLIFKNWDFERIWFNLGTGKWPVLVDIKRNSL